MWCLVKVRIHKRDNQKQQKNSHKNNHKTENYYETVEYTYIPIWKSIIFIKHNPQTYKVC